MDPFFLYVRKSTEGEDRQILSIQSQIKELKTLAEKMGLKIVEIFTEAKSAKAPGRPVFNRMMERIKKGEAKGILCWKLDRLSRNPIDSGVILWAIKENHIKIVTPTQTFSEENNNTLLAYFEYGTAQHFIEELSKNVKRGLKTKIEMGWMPGRAPIGYLNRKELEKGKKDIVKDTERFSLIRKMWDLMLTGNYTPSQILEIANRKWGFRTRKYKRMGGKPLSLSTIYKIFGNPFYVGWLPINGEIYQGKHEPMVTQTEFDRVQKLLGRVNKAKPHHHQFAFTGLVRCGECGCLITAENKQKVNKGTGKIHYYTYYHCTKKKRYLSCLQKSLEVKELENQILNYLQKIQIPEKFVSWAIKYLKENQKIDCRSQEEIQQSLKKTIGKVEKELENLLKMRCRDLLSDEEYLKEKSNLLTEQKRLQERLKQLKEKTGIFTEFTIKALQFFHQAQYWFKKGSLQEKRVILESIGSNLTLKDRKLHIVAKKPFLILEKSNFGVKENFARLEPSNICLIKEKGATSFAPLSIISG